MNPDKTRRLLRYHITIDCAVQTRAHADALASFDPDSRIVSTVERYNGRHGLALVNVYLTPAEIVEWEELLNGDDDVVSYRVVQSVEEE